LDLLAGKLEASKPSVVGEGEAPPLQERGVVGLHLVKSASFFRETASHLGLDLGCLRPQLGGTTALGHDLGEDDDAAAACDCLSRSSSSTTTASSVIAALTHSSLTIIVCASLRKRDAIEKDKEEWLMRMRKMLKARKIEIVREREKEGVYIRGCGIILYGRGGVCVGGGEGGVDSSYLCFVRLPSLTLFSF
jgi:hypothetical protein